MKRQKYSLSHYRLASFDMGELVPVGCVEVLPGDTFQHAMSALIRVSPLVAPVMHPVHVRIHHWFVPTRLVWEDFENFITGGPDGNNSSVPPTIALLGASTAATGSLADYLGVPTDNNITVSALPFRAYNLIWNECYRDQDLQTELAISLASGADSTTAKTLQNCDWEKDQFTTARPWEQKGPDITMPMQEVILNPDGAPYNATDLIIASSGGTPSDEALGIDSGEFVRATSDTPLVMDPSGNWVTSGGSINALREAFALQRYEEARARYGSRYTEYLRYLGIKSSDARLQRPEYLGGGKQTIQFSEVLQTAEGTNPVGEMRGHGISAVRSNRYRRFFEEHGYVISLISIRPKTMYADGLQRMWSRETKEDYYQKELCHIGQQEVLNKEIYAPHASPDGVFGYQDRYHEYRRVPSGISGEFRDSVYSGWHFAREFSGDPSLNASFVSCVPRTDPFASSTNDTMLVMCNHSLQARRMVARSGHSFVK